jgi:hypothetical protein
VRTATTAVVLVALVVVAASLLPHGANRGWSWLV